MVHARTTTCSDGLPAAQTPDGEPHREQHNAGGHHETKVETRERQSAAAVDDDRLRNSMVLCIRMLLRTPELLLNAASRLTVTLLCGWLRKCRRSGEEQSSADHSAGADVLDSHNRAR
jgi:hypothetical protein